MNLRLLLLLIILLIGCAEAESEEIQDRQQPNIIYILADDLGYGELGVYGQEKIETPNLDALARSGMKFTQHYSGSPVCAPSRYVLMTGKHPGNAYIRGNSELDERGDIWDFEAMYENPELEGQRPIPPSTVTVAEVLQEAGYTTGAFGKWGLGGPNTEGHPNEQGFDCFYGYLCQRQAHNYYPTHLWKNDERIHLSNDLVDPHQEGLSEDADPYDPESYARFQDQPDYSPEFMQEEVLQFIEENQDSPFFLYYPTPIPHVSLQAPQRWIDYYVDKFGDEEEPYYSGGSGNLHYAPVRYPKATYAAMISYLDEQVGALVDKLKELGLYENTLIMFSSDNGSVNGLGVDPEHFDSVSPFVSTRVKGTVYEGGIRVPMIATWEGQIPAGTTTDHLSAFWDVMPTLSELIGAEPPEGVDGISFLPTLLGDEEEQAQHDYLYWEYPGSGGQQAVRMGKWKAVRKGILSEGNLEIKLYDLEADIQEQNDVADQYPEVMEEIRRIMETSRTVPELDEFKLTALRSE